MTYCPIPSERSVKYIIFKKNLFYLKSTARATQNRLACHFGPACHRFASAELKQTRGKNKNNKRDNDSIEQCCPTFLTPRPSRAAQDIIMKPRAAPVNSKVTTKIC